MYFANWFEETEPKLIKVQNRNNIGNGSAKLLLRFETPVQRRALGAALPSRGFAGGLNIIFSF